MKTKARKNPADYYFWAEHDKGLEQDVVWLTSKAYFDKHGHLDERERGDDLMPDEFYNNMESCFDLPEDMSLSQARKTLKDLGFVENKALSSKA